MKRMLIVPGTLRDLTESVSMEQPPSEVPPCSLGNRRREAAGARQEARLGDFNTSIMRNKPRLRAVSAYFYFMACVRLGSDRFLNRDPIRPIRGENVPFEKCISPRPGQQAWPRRPQVSPDPPTWPNRTQVPAGRQAGPLGSPLKVAAALEA